MEPELVAGPHIVLLHTHCVTCPWKGVQKCCPCFYIMHTHYIYIYTVDTVVHFTQRHILVQLTENSQNSRKALYAHGEK